LIASDCHKWVSNHERKSDPDPNPSPNPTLTDHPDLTLSIFPSLHSDRRSELIIIVSIFKALSLDTDSVEWDVKL